MSLILSVCGQAEPGLPEPPPVSLTRYTEDYSYLREATNRSGAWWEPLKYIPLDSRDWAYLTLGDDMRLRYEHYWNNQFGSGENPTEDYLRFREFPYADLHLGPKVRVFGQLQNAWAEREQKNPFTDETGADLLQAFPEVRFPVNAESHLTLRAGRQVLFYGSGRLINHGPNIRTSFDAGLAQLETGDWRVDAFYSRPVKPELGSFNDGPDSARQLWAVYATHTFREKPAVGLDLFYIGFENENALFNQGAGNERRHSFGTRFFASNGPWHLDSEGIFQAGEFAGGDLRAWASANQVRYNFPDDVPLKPWLGLRADIVSGDQDPNDRALETFNPMFPRGSYFGEAGVIGPFNLIDLHPVLGLNLGAGWTLDLGSTLYWRQSLDDGIYDLGGILIREDSGSAARYIATQGEVVLGWEVNRNLSFFGAYTVLVPGRFIKESGPAKTVHFLGAHVVFRF